jgi:hypothetical protein
MSVLDAVSVATCSVCPGSNAISIQDLGKICVEGSIELTQ